MYPRDRHWLVSSVLCASSILLCYCPFAGAVSVKYFGAIGDGNTDDSTAFRKALQSTTNEVLVPGGEYLVKDLKIPDGITVRGAGPRSVIRISSGVDFAFLPGNETTIRDPKFTGPAEEKVRVLTNGFVLVANSDVILTHLIFENAHRGGIITDHATKFRISECRFKNVGVAINIQFSHHGMVTNNIV